MGLGAAFAVHVVSLTAAEWHHFSDLHPSKTKNAVRPALQPVITVSRRDPSLVWKAGADSNKLLGSWWKARNLESLSREGALAPELGALAMNVFFSGMAYHMTSCSMSVGGVWLPEPEALFRVSFQSSKSITAKPDILKCFVNRDSTPPDKKRSFQRERRGGAWPVLQTALGPTLHTKQFSAGRAVDLSNGVLDSLKLLLGSVCQTVFPPVWDVNGIVSQFWPPEGQQRLVGYRVFPSYEDLELSRSECVC